MKYKNRIYLICVTLFLICSVVLLTARCGRGGKERTTGPTSKFPTDTVPSCPPSIKPTINVYIENSGSMDGYVAGATDFKHAVYSYLSDIKISNITKEINLFYINSEVVPYGNDISDFIEKLDPNSFRIRGGNRNTSDISNVLKAILQETEENKISIFVSDCIFSPGRNKDADQYLINQQIGIKTNFAEHLGKNPSSTICIYQLSSQFDGFFYNREDEKTKINSRRPFYLWIIGDKKNVSELLGKVQMSKIKGSGVENDFTIMAGNQTIDYAIRPGTGKFRLSKKDPKKGIMKAKKDRNGKVTFAVNANFSQFLLDDTYLKNINNYELNDKDYELTITNSPKANNRYTHSLNLSSDKIKPSHLSIKLKTRIPEWVEQITDSEGLDINANGAINKTYGFKYLINGVYEAFTQQNNSYTEIKISINN
ncbi:hypothetical protein [Bacteroides sp. 224]|uniref:hypothetical protein n=1 Tax=Bacteroides sp. 224 TaxID=2302936 RepID=UPI0013CF416C|nr:hypothetical protein [Bacteroides sp. 224]NDV65646.1 hypothetical protein [Bacteroides sp. 224]